MIQSVRQFDISRVRQLSPFYGDLLNESLSLRKRHIGDMKRHSGHHVIDGYGLTVFPLG